MNAATADMEREERDAFDYVRKLRGFYVRLIQYVLIAGMLTVVNLVVSPNHIWVMWPILGLSIGAIAQAIQLFRPRGLFGPDWERRAVEKRLGRSL